MSEGKTIITAKINVSAIDKARLFKGQKGTYLDITLIRTTNDKFGNDFVVFQSMTKEERLAGNKRAIIGNGKYAGKNPQVAQQQAPQNTPPSSGEYDSNPPGRPGGGDNVPF
jgi:hypothetical protein